MRAGEGYLLGVDVGTTTARCILFDLEGRPVGEAYHEPRVHHPQPNWAEVEPEDWWESTVAVVREALQRAGVPGERVLGVGLSGLQHALIPIDGRGKPLARAMLWMDQRCQPQVEWMVREHSELIEEIMGRRWPVSTTMSAPKLRWIVENQPDLLCRAHKFLLAKDFIRFRLTGTLASDPSDAAGTFLFDQHSGDWSCQMLELVGVSLEKMPPIRDSTEVAGGVTVEAAEATGLAPGTPVVIGGGDTICTLSGANAFDPKRACLYLGTAAWVSIPRPGTTFGSFGATATTGASLKWLVELFGVGDLQHSPGSSYTALLQEAGGVPPGARGLIFLPHLMGERGPQYNPEAKGVLFGLTLAHTRREIARAVLEGCALHLRWILESLGPSDVEEVVAVGGGAKSAFWRGIIADVTGITLLVPRVLEAGALGAAILAGVGVGIYPGVQEAAGELVRIVGRHKPDGARHELYRGIYPIFLELEERVAPLYGRVPVERWKEG